MGSLNRHRIEERIALTVDMNVGAQADSKGIKGHLKSLRAAVGQAPPGAQGMDAFIQKLGGVKKRG